MLTKFKSKADNDVIMLEPNARQILEAVGKSDPAQWTKGIITPAEMPAALAGLAHAIAQDDARRQQAKDTSLNDNETDAHDPAPLIGISLRQRAAPIVKMLERSLEENTPVMWGV